MSGRHFAATAVAVAALTIFGCGNSKTTSSTGSTQASTASTRSSFVSQANGVCARLGTRISKTSTRVGRVQELGRITPRIAALERAALAELTTLTPPSELATDWRAIIADAHVIADNTSALGRYAAANELKRLNRLLARNQRTERLVAVTSQRDGRNNCAHTI